MGPFHHTHRIRAPDGVTLACHTMGEGPAVLLAHGFLSNARTNWIDSGIAAQLADAGFSLFMPDFRGHGVSDAPDDPALYPIDVLATDLDVVRAAFSITDYALVGYSLGARTAARAMARGAKPRRLVLAGMGDSGVLGVEARQRHFEDMIANGPNASNPEAGAFVRQFMDQNGVAAQPALNILRSQAPTPAEALTAITCPTLVLSGVRDHDNGSAAGLAALIPGARLIETPGAHLSAVGKREFREALAAFLLEDLR